MILKPSNDFTPSNIAMLNIAEYPGGKWLAGTALPFKSIPQ